MTYKTSKTIKEYKIKAFGWELVIPAGSLVSNKTAMGYDDNYHFWINWGDYVKNLTGYSNSILAHDLTYYGLNIPAEYCEIYS
jgi:hypothetical protein